MILVFFRTNLIHMQLLNINANSTVFFCVCVCAKYRGFTSLCVDGQQHEQDTTRLCRRVATGLKLRRLTVQRQSCLSPFVVCFCAWAERALLNEFMNKVLRVFGVCVCVSVWGFLCGKVPRRVAVLHFEIYRSLRGKTATAADRFSHVFVHSPRLHFAKVLIEWCCLWNVLTEVL